ncbi:MAG: hypothetical protein IKK70_07595 [Clostridia bacterium]|nr:hypothetical protein [Clostridia bacterium]
MIVLYWIFQLTWGILQTLLGFFMLLLNIKCRHSLYNGCVVTEWKKTSGLSLGLFVFVPKHSYECINGITSLSKRSERVLAHEYGHTIQSLILGPLYLFVIGIPSLTWATLPYFRRSRREKGISYYSFYPEKWADRLAVAVTKTGAIEK